MKNILIIIFLFIAFGLYSQDLSEINTDTLNQYNDKGKKTGYWIQLLNKNWNPTKKEEKAVFFSYVYYENGKDLIGKIGFAFFKPVIKISGNKAQKNKIIILDGTYTFYYPFGEKQKNVSLCYEKGVLVK